MSKFTDGPWHLMFSGVASTPDYSIRAGETFKDALTGPLICTFPETTTKTTEEVTANAKLVLAAPKMLLALEACMDAIRNTPRNKESPYDQKLREAYQLALDAALDAKGGAK